MAVPRARRALMLTALWRTMRSSVRPGGPGLTETATAAPRMLRAALAGRYPGFGRGRLALAAVAVAYIVSPVDVVPEGLLLALGLVDDVAIATWLAGMLLVETDRFLAWERSAPRGGGYVPGDYVRGDVIVGDVVGGGVPAR